MTDHLSDPNSYKGGDSYKQRHLFLFTVTHHPRTKEYSAQCVSGAGVHGPWWALTAAEALANAREGTKAMIARDIDQAPAVARVKGEPFTDNGQPFKIDARVWPTAPVPDENKPFPDEPCSNEGGHHGVTYCTVCYPGGKPT